MFFDIGELGRIARGAFKRGDFQWAKGVPSKYEISDEIRRQLLQIDKLRRAPGFESVETSCGCITVRCERDAQGETDEVEVFVELGYAFVPKGQRIAG